MRITRSVKLNVEGWEHMCLTIGWTMADELSHLNRYFNTPHIMDHSTPKHLFRLIVSLEFSFCDPTRDNSVY